MEWVSFLLSGLLGLLSPVGVITERVATGAIRDRLLSVEQLAVRVDNTPSYRLLKGQVERVRIAGRGVVPITGVRLEAVELETEAIALNPTHLRQGQLQLDRPLTAGGRLVVTETDVNQILQSPLVLEQLTRASVALPGGLGQQAQRVDLSDPHIEFLDHNRLRLQLALKDRTSAQQFSLGIESGLGLIAGRKLQLIDPILSVNGVALPTELTQLLTSGISQQLDLGQFDQAGIMARVLQLQIEGDRLSLAGVVRVEPRALRPTPSEPSR